MLVECLGNKGIHLPPNLLALGGYGTADTDYGMIIGKRYIVYAMSALSGRSVQYCLDAERLYEVPAELFRLIDGRISRHWGHGQLRYDAGEGCKNSIFLWGYPEWVSSNDHRLGIVEGQKHALDIFENHRREMELEFATPTVTRTAKTADEDWILCDACADAWQPQNRLDELVRCPSCGTIQRFGRGQQS